MSEIICIRFPTIQSGVVLRWYENEVAHAKGVEVANAGREEARFFVFPTDEFRAEVEAAHRLIRGAYARAWHPTIDTSRWETHRSKGFLSSEIEPLDKVTR